MIFGDYDGDGITSSTLLAKGLLKLGGEVQVRLPPPKKDMVYQQR